MSQVAFQMKAFMVAGNISFTKSPDFSGDCTVHELKLAVKLLYNILVQLVTTEKKTAQIQDRSTHQSSEQMYFQFYISL